MLPKLLKRSKTKFIVSIGAGANQIPLINEALKLGYNVIGVDKNDSASGLMYCDLKILESIDNYKEIYVKLVELLVDGEISAIMTKSYGKAVKTASFLSAKFNLPFLPFKKSFEFINKKKMKSVFMDNNILTPELISFAPKSSSIRIKKGSFPIIVKPYIGHAKIDVKLIKNASELKKIFPMRKKEIIFEKYIQGDEIIVIGIINNRKFHLVDITDKKTVPAPYFIDILHISPSKYYNLYDEIKNIGQKIADAFEITSSPLVMELIINKKNKIYVIEAVAEFGGEFIPDILVPARTGYNFIKEAIKSATNSGFKPPPLMKKNGSAVVVKYITGKKGILVSCNPGAPDKYSGTIYSRIFKEIGSKINKPKTNLDRIGVVIVKEKNVRSAVKLAQNAVRKFSIRIKQ